MNPDNTAVWFQFGNQASVRKTERERGLLEFERVWARAMTYDFDYGLITQSKVQNNDNVVNGCTMLDVRNHKINAIIMQINCVNEELKS